MAIDNHQGFYFIPFTMIDCIKKILALIFILLVASLGYVSGQDTGKIEPDSIYKQLAPLKDQNPDSLLIVLKPLITELRSLDLKVQEARFRLLEVYAMINLSNLKGAMDEIYSNRKLYDEWIPLSEDAEKDRLIVIRGLTHSQEASILHEMGKYEESIKHEKLAKEAIIAAQRDTIKAQRQIISLNGNLAVSYYYLGREREAISTFYENIKILQKINKPREVSGAFYNIGVMELNLGNLREALNNYLKALEISETHKFSNQAAIISAICHVYRELDDFETAISYARKAVTISDSFGDKLQKAFSMTDLADNFKEVDKIDSALFYYQEALLIVAEVGPLDDQAYVLERISTLHIDQKEYNKALLTLERGFKVIQGEKLPEEELLLSIAKARCLYALDQTQKAVKVVARVTNMAEKTDKIRFKQDGYKIAHEVYSALGNYPLAYDNLFKYAAYTDSVRQKEKVLEIARKEYDYQLKHETEQLALEQEKQEVIHEQELKQERMIQYGAFGATGFVVIILLILFRSFQEKKKNNRALKYRNEIIEIKNEELLDKNAEISDLREKEKALAEETLAMKERELTTVTMLSHEKNSILQSLEEHIGSLSKKVDERVIPDLQEIKKIIKANLSEESWSEFTLQFEKVHPRFFSILKTKFPSLTHYDLRLCAFLRVGMGNKEIARVSAISADSVKKSIYRLKKKMDLDAEQDLREFFLKL